MEIVRYLAVAWVAIGAVLLALLAYRGTLTRYEEDQIFLSEAVSVQAQAQDEIQRKLHRIKPFLTVALWLIAALTSAIVVLFVRDMLAHLQ
jgi:Na+/melibiose symporter-like transporter